MLDPRSAVRISVVALLALVAGACGGSDDGVQGIRDQSREVFFEIPNDWSVIDESVLQTLDATPYAAQGTFNLPIVSRVVFHGPGFAVADAGLDPASYGSPVGAAVVRTIPDGARDFINRYLLAEVVVPYHDRAIATEHLKRDIEIADGYEGVEVLVTYADSENQVPAAILFIAVTDPTDRMFYSIAVGCSAECFNLYGEVIGAIIDSWLVNTR